MRKLKFLLVNQSNVKAVMMMMAKVSALREPLMVKAVEREESFLITLMRKMNMKMP